MKRDVPTVTKQDVLTTALLREILTPATDTIWIKDVLQLENMEEIKIRTLQTDLIQTEYLLQMTVRPTEIIRKTEVLPTEITLRIVPFLQTETTQV
jgi:hypothetical protein